MFPYPKVTSFAIALLLTTFHLVAHGNNSCSAYFVTDESFNATDLQIPNDRSINLSVKRNSVGRLESWTMQGVFVADKDVHTTFLAAQHFESIQQLAPFINIFKLSPNRKKLQCGIKVLPGLSFQQNFKISAVDNAKTINLVFTEGPFAGLRGQIRFIEMSANQTVVALNTSGTLTNTQVPFFITNSILENMSKAVIKRWRTQLESE